MEARQFAAAVNTASKQASSGIPILVDSGVPDVVGKTVAEAAAEVMKLKLSQPKFVDAKGQHPNIFSFKNWRVVAQSGIANSLLFEVEKFR